MSDTHSLPASRLLLGSWAAFAAGCTVLMFAFPGMETIPFHFIWISLALLHGTRPLSLPHILVTLSLVTIVTSWALLLSVSADRIGLEELSEVPLMAALFLVMVWHVDRRQAALRQVQVLAAAEQRRAEAQRLFVRLGSHELRTPITIARGYTELIRTAHPDDETAQDTGIVLDELAKLERITTRLLTLMLVDGAATPTLVDLDAALERIIRRWTPTAARSWVIDSRAAGRCSASSGSRRPWTA